MHNDTLNYSFEAKLILADENTQELYLSLIKFCKEYGVEEGMTVEVCRDGSIITLTLTGE